MMKVKCLLCEGSVPSDDYEVQVEHTLSWHKATSKDEAERMVRSHFVNYYEEEFARKDFAETHCPQAPGEVFTKRKLISVVKRLVGMNVSFGNHRLRGQPAISEL